MYFTGSASDFSRTARPKTLTGWSLKASASFWTSGLDGMQRGHQVPQKSSTTTLPRSSESLTFSPLGVESSKSGARSFRPVPTIRGAAGGGGGGGAMVAGELLGTKVNPSGVAIVKVPGRISGLSFTSDRIQIWVPTPAM